MGTPGLPEILISTVEWLPVAVLMANDDGAIMLVNRALERLLGYARAELIGQSVDMLLPDAHRSAHHAFRAAFMQAPEPRAMASGREIFARRKDGSEVTVEITLAPIRVDQRTFVLASIADLSARRLDDTQLRKALDERIDFEALIGDLASQFVNLRADDVDRTIEEALGRLVRALDLDRSALFQVAEDTGDFIHTHQWTRPGHSAPPPRVAARAQFPWHLSKMLGGDTVMFSTVDDVPDGVDRASLRAIGTRSGVTIPLVVRGRTWGALTFATINSSRGWPAELVNRFRVVALMFANVLARKESDERLRHVMLGQANQRARLRDENAYLRHELNAVVGTPAVVGNSTAFRRVLEQVGQVATSDAAVLLQGETGTGKSLLGARIHELSSRRERAMVRINCAALKAASVESELFGREPGTYAGIDVPQVGLLELANESTLFFDEIADLTADTQARLARMLHSGELHPGSARPIKTDFRVIASTRRDLPALIAGGAFRDDLYYRLNVLSIHVPPLRERPADIPLLVWRFVDEFADAYGKTIDTIDHESMAQLQKYHWPGNARELRNVVERAMLVADTRRLRIAPPLPVAPKSRGPAKKRGTDQP